MTDEQDNTGSKDITPGLVSTIKATADCSYCDRTESYDKPELAKAWMVGHILEEHSERLAPLANNEEQGDK
ncbi:MAG: hypothetical protein J07AB43_01630 [Candidatus Nanosalina sp. J07AB43]|jgi:hypothetical protein|nr:MAG: hypothetical protein J07AB43_01630 [Candidatus Nanosalina sp. J07AB43]